MAAKSIIAEQVVRLTVEGAKEGESTVRQFVQGVTTLADAASKKLGAVKAALAALGTATGRRVFGDLARQEVELERASAKLRKALDWQAAVAQHGRLGAGLRLVGQEVAALGARAAAAGRNALGIAVALAAPVIGMTRVALEGTRESDRLALSWTYLGKVVGQEFAPWVRLLTSGIVALADRFRALDGATRAGVAKFALLAAGAAAFVALLPVMAAGIAVLGAAWAVLTSPITITIALIVGVIYAGKRLFDFFTQGSAQAASSMQEANKGWVDHLLDVIEFAGTKFAEFCNFIDRQWQRTTHGLASLWAAAFEDKGTQAELRRQGAEMEARFAKGEGQLFNIEKFKGDIRNIRGALAELPKLADILGLIQNGIGEAKMTVKLNVGFESFRDTFDRLQKEMAAGASQEEELRRIREQGAALNQIVGKIADGLGKIGREFGVVGP